MFLPAHSLLSYGSSLQSLGQDERDSDAFAARLTAESNDSNEFLTHLPPMTHWTFTYFRLSLLALYQKFHYQNVHLRKSHVCYEENSVFDFLNSFAIDLADYFENS